MKMDFFFSLSFPRPLLHPTLCPGRLNHAHCCQCSPPLRLPLVFDYQGAHTEEENEAEIIILFLFLRFFFLMWTIFKVLIEFFTTMLLFHVLVFWLWSMWDLSLLTRNWSLNHWTTGEIPIKIPFYSCGINRSRAEGLSFSTSALCAWVPEPTSTLTPQGRPTAYSYEAYSVVTFLVLFPHSVHTFMSCPLLHSNCPIQALLLFPAEIWTQENSEKGLYMLTVEKGLPR